LRILFVNQRAYLPQLLGGVEQTTFELCRQLTQMGHQTAVMCGLVRGDATWLRNRIGSRLKRRGFPPGRYLGSPVYRGYDPRVGLEEVLADFGADGLVIAGGTHESFDLAAQCARTGLRSLYYFHDLETVRRLKTPDLLGGVGFVANSAYTARVVTEILGRTCIVIPPLIDRAGYRTTSAHGERRHITMVNPRRVKGGQMAFELAQACPDIPFAFVEAWQDGNEFVHALRVAARRLPNVTWHRPTTDMRRIYATTRILLVPSDWEETWGRVASEAHVSGIPVLARAVAALPESVGPGGILLGPQAPLGDWIRALRSMWEDGNLYETLSARAREFSERTDAQPEHLATAFISALQSPIAGATSSAHTAAAAATEGALALRH
jgi:glycosyltransferase involved in cell wall biosynthesis